MGIITVEFFFGIVVLLSTVLKERAARKIEQQTRELERRSDSAEIRVAYAEERGHALSETLFALAALELKERAPVTSNGDVFDALAVSMNMVAAELDARVGELERHSTLIAGIAQIGTRLSLETNPQDNFARLAEELERIDIRLALATWNADSETLDFIYYSNPVPAIADSILKGFGLDRHRVPPTIFPPFAECAQERKIVFVPDILGLVTTHFKNFPTWLLERSLKFTRSERGVAAFVLPLLAEERLIGILELWSGNLREDDAATLQLMASQLSAALYRAEQHARLQEHADALAAANERLAHLLQTLPIIIYTSKAEGDYEVTYISETLRQIAGYTPEHFLSSGTFWRDHLYPNDAARVLGELARLPESKFLQIDYRWQVADGSYRWFSDSMRLVADKDGKSNHIVGVWQDISERKDAERQLQASEERFRDLFESAPDGIILSDTEGRIRLVNRAMASMLGYTPEELSNLDLAMTYPEVDRPELKERLRALAQHGSLRFERAMLRKDGTIFPVDATVNRTSNGMYQGILRDITARRQADQQLRRALDEAESASRAKSQFLSVLSHELFTPLNVILGFAQLLELDADKLGARGQRGIEQINLAGRRMQAMISDLLDYARLDMGAWTLRCKRCRHRHCWTSRARNSVRLPPKNRFGGRVKILPPRTLCAQTRAASVKRSTFLLDNAIKFTPNGGVVQVTCQVPPEPPPPNGNLQTPNAADKLLITVSDTGIGIRAEHLPHIFDPFSQADTSTTRRHSGIGISLALARRLVELQGGAIRASSAGEGMGATFWIELVKEN